MTILYANPYDITATGFYFESFEEFQEKAANLRNESGEPVEEFEIDLIEGNPGLFKAAKVTQANLELWFEELDDIEEGSDKDIAIRYLLDHVGYDLDDALRYADEVNIYAGRLEDYARELVAECCDLPEIAEQYFDYEAFARDLQFGGGVVEIDQDIWCVNPTEF